MNIKIAIAQLNFTVGDLDNNTKKIKDTYVQYSTCSDLIIFPELSIIGYPAEDLLLNNYFQNKADTCIRDLAKISHDCVMIVGAIKKEENCLYNVAYILGKGQILDIIYKNHLPNYGIFDERRVFTESNLIKIFELNNKKLGIMICEDMWTDEVSLSLKKKGADIFIVINASPFEKDKYKKRLEIAQNHSSRHNLDLIYVNLVGGQDDIVFDGGSFLCRNNIIKYQMDFWQECVEIIDLGGTNSQFNIEYDNSDWKLEQIYQACLIGLRDYITKNNLYDVILGLSGGIDSALTAVMASDALGKDRVRCIMLPSEFTSKSSLDDAQELANKIKFMQYDILAIDEITKLINNSLLDIFKNYVADVTEENIQARVRGILLMAISNKFGSLLLSTGNKSELATGYATLYGDMCGGYNMIKDIYKTEIYDLANWRNRNIPKNSLSDIYKPIPQNILDKHPTAELRHNQIDQDTLPDYKILDEILYQFIEEGKSVIDIGDTDLNKKIYNMLKGSEYKRRQSCLGVKISKMALGKDRRFPIVNKF